MLDLIEPHFTRWGYAIVFAGTLLENSAFVGVVVPGDVILVLGGFYAERGALRLLTVMGVAFSGAVIGDTLGYGLGRFAGRRLVDRFGERVFLSRKRIERMERYFARHGMWSVAIGRFAPGVRTINTFAAGTSRMPYPRFLVAVAGAASLWSVVVPAAGFLFSESLHLVDRSLGAAGIVLLLLFVAFLVWSYRRMLRRLEVEEGPR